MDLLGVGTIVETVGKLAGDLVTTDKERLAADLQAYQAETSRMQGQLEVNKVEAASSSVFVSGARPAVMWICAAALAYASVVEPIARFLARVCFGYVGDFPVIDTDLTMQILFGILGLGAFRTVEKLKGKAR